MRNIRVMPKVFNFATFGGFWLPTYWKSSFVVQLYNIYSCLCFCQINILLVSQIIELLLYTKNVDDVVEIVFVMIAIINGSVKGITIRLQRTYVLHFSKLLLTKEFSPQNYKEKNICLQSEKKFSYITISCSTLAEITVFAILFGPLIFTPGKFILPIKAWFPYDTNNNLGYSICYIQQVFGFLVVSISDVSIDFIVISFMFQTTVQLNLIMSRLQELSWKSSIAQNKNVSKEIIRLYERKIMRECIQHHLAIFRFSADVSRTFAPIIFIQFLSSSLVLAITGYQLSQKISDGTKFITIMLYMISMLVEFFLFNWFANEAKHKSLEFQNVLSEIDWTSMHIKTNQELIIMMIGSTRPIIFSCGPLIQLSLESFTKILKVSYSAINLLKSSS